ncbi:SCP2 sterol-binding domain-containing protein [Streptomyces sp. NPDC005065]|uniref:SCP2 sterol-binding domain-containing protein n=1 Tax=unclassified Streptomyces TaxID=2593676 RepID=UPI0033AE055D
MDQIANGRIYVAIFSSPEAAEEIFGKLFGILRDDEEFTSRLRKHHMSVRLTQTDPDCRIYISADELVIGSAAPEQATITIRMSSDTAHALWLGKLMMPTAIATRKVRIQGKVARVLDLVPILRPAFDRYPDIAKQAGLPV